MNTYFHIPYIYQSIICEREARAYAGKCVALSTFREILLAMDWLTVDFFKLDNLLGLHIPCVSLWYIKSNELTWWFGDISLHSCLKGSWWYVSSLILWRLKPSRAGSSYYSVSHPPSRFPLWQFWLQMWNTRALYQCAKVHVEEHLR